MGLLDFFLGDKKKNSSEKKTYSGIFSSNPNANTYNPTTGVYIDKSGQGYSTPTAPSGSNITFSDNSGGVVKPPYNSGGGSSKKRNTIITTPDTTSPLPTNTQANTNSNPTAQSNLPSASNTNLINTGIKGTGVYNNPLSNLQPKISPSGVVMTPGTYDKATGTYYDPNRGLMSTASPPSNVRVINSNISGQSIKGTIQTTTKTIATQSSDYDIYTEQDIFKLPAGWDNGFSKVKYGGTGTVSSMTNPSNIVLPKDDLRVIINPEIRKVSTGTSEIYYNGRYINVPTAKFIYFDPFGKDLGNGATESIERPATESEIDYFNKQSNFLVASDKKYSPIKEGFNDIVSNVGLIYNVLQSNIRKGITEPTIGKFFESQNFNPDKKDFSAVTNFLNEQVTPFGKVKNVAPFLPYFLETVAGAGVGILQEVRTKPLKTIAVFGIGAGIGAGSEAVISGVTSISPTAGALTGGAFKIGGLALTGGYGAKVIKEVATSPSYSQAGSVIGTNLLYGSVGGLGFATGQKGFNVIKGYWNVRNREFIDIPQGEYPTLPQTQKQVEIFQKNVYPEFGNEAGAFHTTPNNFWKSGTITPEPGSSELPGLYGSYKISTPFSKINKNIYSGFNIPKSIKEVFTGSTNPAVAYLKPKGFRYSPAEKVSSGELGWIFKQPAQEGYADIPLIKSEAEAIFRPEAGSYNIQPEFSKFYTKIFDVPVKIDVFKSGASNVVSVPTSNLNLIGGAVSYNLPPSSYPIFNPGSVVTSYLSTKESYSSNKESYVSIAPSTVNNISSSQPWIKSSKDFISISNIYSSKRSSSSKISNITSSRVIDQSNLISPSIDKSSISKLSFLSSRNSSNYYLSSLSSLSSRSNISHLAYGFGKDWNRRIKPSIDRTISPRRYTPSFGSFIIGLSSKRVPKGKFSGLELRPIIKNKGKPKKINLFKW